MKTTLHTIILQVLKRGQLTPPDRLNISRFLPLNPNRRVFDLWETVTGDDTQTEKINMFFALPVEEQKKMLKDCRTPDTDTPPRPLTRADKILFLDVLQNGLTQRNIEKLGEMGINPAHDVFFNDNGDFCLCTPKELYKMMFPDDPDNKK